MIKRIANKYMPRRESIESNKYLSAIMRKVGHREYLWEFKQKNVVLATLIGVFWAIMPMPFQMFPSAICAIFFRANILVAIAWVWVSNPLTMLPILYASYYLGCVLLGIPAINSFGGINFTSLFTDWQMIVKPLVVGSILFGSISAISMAFVVWLLFQIKKYVK